MLRSLEEGATKYEARLLCNGKRFQVSGTKRTATGREKVHSEAEGSDYYAIPQIKEGSREEEGDYQLSGEVCPHNIFQVGHCVEPMTPCASPKSKVRTNTLLQLSGKDSQNNSGSSGVKCQSSGLIGQNIGNNVVVVVSQSNIHKGITLKRSMGDDLRMSVFHGNGYEDPE